MFRRVAAILGHLLIVEIRNNGSVALEKINILKSKTKIMDVHYDNFEMQSYMKSSKLNLDEVRLFFALRSKSYPAKMNYKKMKKGNLKCTFLCDSEETRDLLFESCQPIQSRISYPVNVI